jgi:hypothetical protein
MDLPTDTPALDTVVRNVLKPLVREHGAAKIGERYGLAPSTVARLAADAPVYSATVIKAAIALGLITVSATPLALCSTPIPTDNNT